MVSLAVIATMWVEETRFQLASTALTVTVTGEPAVWVSGVPVLPVVVPGAAVSPGIRTCNFEAVPAVMTIPETVPVFEFPSVAVMFIVSAVLSLVLIVNVPELRVFVLSPNVPLPSLSNCTFPVPVIVTTVLLSAETV